MSRPARRFSLGVDYVARLVGRVRAGERGVGAASATLSGLFGCRLVFRGVVGQRDAAFGLIEGAFRRVASRVACSRGAVAGSTASWRGGGAQRVVRCG